MKSLCLLSLLPLAAFGVETGPLSGARNLGPGTNDIIIMSDEGGRYRPPVAVYRGNVRVTDTQVALTCELLTIYFQTNQNIDLIIAETNVVISQKGTIAFADKAVYTATNDVIVLTGTLSDAVIDAPQGWWTGGMIIYDRRDNSVFSPGPLKMGGPVKGGVFGTNTLGIDLPHITPVDTKQPAPPPPARKTK